MGYGCASYIASSSGGLKKLDVVQRRAEKLCGVTFQPLGARREASCFGLICKLLDEVCVQPLLDMCPQFQLEGVSVNSAMTRSSNVQITDMIGKLRTGKSLQTFSRSFIAQAHHIFEKLPSDLQTQGLEPGWISQLFERTRCPKRVLGQLWPTSQKCVCVCLRCFLDIVSNKNSFLAL